MINEQPHVCFQEIIIFFSIKNSQFFINWVKTIIKDLTGGTHRRRFKSISSVQSLSHVRLFATPWMEAHQASLSVTNSLSWWRHPTISSSVIPFSSCIQSLPASGSFQMSQFFTSGGQSIGVSAIESVLPMNTQDWSPLGWTGWISLKPRDSQESSPTPQFKSISSSVLSFLYSQLLHPYMTTG